MDNILARGAPGRYPVGYFCTPLCQEREILRARRNDETPKHPISTVQKRASANRTIAPPFWSGVAAE